MYTIEKVDSNGEILVLPLVKHSLNAHLFIDHGLSITEPSQTIPDQSLSIRQILDRYARGLPLDIRTPQWEENPDIDDVAIHPERMDLAERQEFAEQAKQELQQIKHRIAQKKQNKAIVEPPPTPQPPPSEN